jgi:hypothetical protein
LVVSSGTDISPSLEADHGGSGPWAYGSRDILAHLVHSRNAAAMAKGLDPEHSSLRGEVR